MLGLRPLCTAPLAVEPAGANEPYEIDISRDTVLDEVHLVVAEIYVEDDA